MNRAIHTCAGLVMAALIACVACGNSPEPASPTPAPTPPVAAEASSEPAPPAASAEPARPRKPFEIYSSCTEVVSIAFGEDAKAEGAGKRTLAPSSTIEGPRNSDGNQTVWLLDKSGEPLVKVKVTRGMKRVEIGRSCRTLDAR